jgi:hypothetical protein
LAKNEQAAYERFVQRQTILRYELFISVAVPFYYLSAVAQPNQPVHKLARQRLRGQGASMAG